MRSYCNGCEGNLVAFKIFQRAKGENFQKSIPKFFEIILDRVDKIKETPEVFEWNLRVRKVNKTRALVGSMIVRQPISNEYKTEVKILKKQGKSSIFL